MSNQSILLDIVLNKYFEDAGIIDSSKGFERFASEQIFKDQDLDMDEIEQGLIGDSGDGGVDGFFLLLNGEIINDLNQIPENIRSAVLDVYLIQYKNSTSIEELVLDRFLGSCDFIFKLV